MPDIVSIHPSWRFSWTREKITARCSQLHRHYWRYDHTGPQSLCSSVYKLPPAPIPATTISGGFAAKSLPFATPCLMAAWFNHNFTDIMAFWRFFLHWAFKALQIRKLAHSLQVGSWTSSFALSQPNGSAPKAPTTSPTLLLAVSFLSLEAYTTISASLQGIL